MAPPIAANERAVSGGLGAARRSERCSEGVWKCIRRGVHIYIHIVDTLCVSEVGSVLSR